MSLSDIVERALERKPETPDRFADPVTARNDLDALMGPITDSWLEGAVVNYVVAVHLATVRCNTEVDPGDGAKAERKFAGSVVCLFATEQVLRETLADMVDPHRVEPTIRAIGRVAGDTEMNAHKALTFCQNIEIVVACSDADRAFLDAGVVQLGADVYSIQLAHQLVAAATDLVVTERMLDESRFGTTRAVDTRTVFETYRRVIRFQTDVDRTKRLLVDRLVTRFPHGHVDALRKAERIIEIAKQSI